MTLSDDREIFVASWPRSGNTMLRAMLFHCCGLRSRAPKGEHPRLTPEARKLVGSDLPPSDDQPVVPVKTHCIRPSPRSVYVVRHGLAACVSHWTAIVRAPGYNLKLETVIAGGNAPCSWENHVLAWLASEPLLVRFEQMVADPMATVRHVADFMGVPVLRHDPPGFADLAKLAPGFFIYADDSRWISQTTPRQRELFEQINGEAMGQLGYTCQ